MAAEPEYWDESGDSGAESVHTSDSTGQFEMARNGAEPITWIPIHASICSRRVEISRPSGVIAV